jgi:ribose-phosphate pyrophosphokinase
VYGELKLFGGRAHPRLTEEICAYLNVAPGKVTTYNFSDGEIFCQLDENVRGADVFVVQPTCPPVNENLVELLVMLDAFKRSSARRVTAVLPYFGYARQDKKDKPRVPITSKLIADLISKAGADRVLTMDLHAAQIQGFFDIPVDHLFAAPVILEAFSRLEVDSPLIVSPDAGGVERARAIAKRLGVGLAIVDKRRTKPNEAEVMNVIGSVEGHTTLIIDDIIDTAGTLTKTVEALRAHGAHDVMAVGVHGVLSGPAIDRLKGAPVSQIFVTDTTPIEEKLARLEKLRPLSVAPLLGEAVKRIHEDSSVSSLFV